MTNGKATGFLSAYLAACGVPDMAIDKPAAIRAGDVLTMRSIVRYPAPETSGLILAFRSVVK